MGGLKGRVFLRTAFFSLSINQLPIIKQVDFILMSLSGTEQQEKKSEMEKSQFKNHDEI